VVSATFQEFRRTDLPAQRVQPVQVADPGDQTTARQVRDDLRSAGGRRGSRWRRAVPRAISSRARDRSRKVSVKKHTSDEPQAARFSGGGARVMVVGRTLPFSMPMALRINTAAGGVFITKVKLRSL